MSQADLRELLTSRGKTTRQAGVAQNYAIDLAKGRKSAGPNAIAKMAAALGVEPETVFAACAESQRRAKRMVARAATQPRQRRA